MSEETATRDVDDVARSEARYAAGLMFWVGTISLVIAFATSGGAPDRGAMLLLGAFLVLLGGGAATLVYGRGDRRKAGAFTTLGAGIGAAATVLLEKSAWGYPLFLAFLTGFIWGTALNAYLRGKVLSPGPPLDP